MAEFATALNAMIERHGRLSDPVIGQWVEIVEGCRMPEDGQSVLVTCDYENPSDGIPFVDRGFYISDPTNEATDRKDWFNVMDSPHYRRQDGTYRTKYGSVVTAWMPAPQPWKRGE